MKYRKIPEWSASLFEYDKKTGGITLKLETDGSKSVQMTTDHKGYMIVSGFGRGGAIKAHRLAWFLAYGEQPKMDIDHINGNKSDNRLCNLRLVTPSENMSNQRKAKANAPTRYIGVRVTGRKKPFAAQITKNGKQTYLGSFATAKEAHAAYLSAKTTIHRLGSLATV